MMKRYDMIIVGAGPAGLSAAIEAAKHGMHVVVYDENAKPGGQLFSSRSAGNWGGSFLSASSSVPSISDAMS